MSLDLIQSCAASIGYAENEVTETLDDVLKGWHNNSDLSPTFLRQFIHETFDYLNLIRRNYKKHNSDDEMKHWVERFAGRVTSEMAHRLSTVKGDVVGELGIQMNRVHQDLGSQLQDKMAVINTSLTFPLADMTKAIESRLEKTEMVVENRLLTSKTESQDKLMSLERSLSNVDKLIGTVHVKLDGMNAQQNNRDVTSALCAIRSDLSNAVSLMNSIPDNEMKRKTSEDYVETMLRKYLPRQFRVKSVAKESNQMDFHISTPQGLLIGIDVKNWGRNVDAGETQKTKDLLIKHATLNVGIIVSMKSNIESYDTIHEQNIGQQRMLWYYPNALDQSINGLVALVIMCDTISPLMKLESMDKDSVDTPLATLGKYFAMLLDLAKNARDIDLNISSLQKTVDKIQQKASTQRTIFERIIGRCEVVLVDVFHQITTNTETEVTHTSPPPPPSRKRKTPTNKKTSYQSCIPDP